MTSATSPSNDWRVSICAPVTTLLNAFADADWLFDEYSRRIDRPVDREVVRTFSVLGITMLLSTHYMGIWMYAQDRSTDFLQAWNRSARLDFYTI